jgi:hypothetical protein
MTPERDIERVLEAWMAQGSSTMPDRLFDAVVDQIERVPQRRARRSLTRFPSMQTMLRVAATAVIVLVIGIGIGQLTPTGPYDSGPSPLPSPLASPTQPLDLPLSFGPIEAGTYFLGNPAFNDSPLSRMTATVPEGWQGIRGNTFANLFQTADEFPAGSISMALPDNFFIDPCDTSVGLMDPPLGPSVDDFVTALAKLPGYQTTEPVDVIFQGYSGKYLEEVGPPSVTQCADGFSHPWQTKYNETGPYDFDDQHGRLWVLDVDGVRLLIELVGSNAAPHPTGGDPVSLAEQQQVFDSIRIAPAPVASPAASPLASPTT